MTTKEVTEPMQSKSAGNQAPIRVDLNLRNYFLNQPYNPTDCYQCGTCTATCPLNSATQGERFTVRKLFHEAQLGITPEYLIWECVTCKECEERCPRDVDIVESIIALRRYMYKKRNLPTEYEQLLWAILEEGNPFGETRKARYKWMNGLNIPNALDGTKNLLFVGDANAYDPRLQRVARELSLILQKANIEFGTLGNEEKTSGESIKVVGETAFMETLIQENVDLFNKTGAERIITISPHDYDFMKQEYPRYGLKAEVVHYTELFDELIGNDVFKFKNKLDMSLTYHDPCYLGRYNGLYDPPRNILENVPGVELLEMKHRKTNALCCGGGGGAMFREVKGERLSDKRIMEAKEIDASAVFTSCPFCIQNLEDASKTTNVNIPVNDVIELISRAIGVTPMKKK